MLPLTKTNNFLEEQKDSQSNGRYAFLNVNAIEFFPSTTAQRQEHTNSAPFISEGQMHNSQMSSSATNDNASTVQKQDYTYSEYIMVDQMETNDGDGGPDQRQEYTPLPKPLPYIPVGYLQDFNISGRETIIDDATCSQRQEYSHLPYSLVGDMNNFKISGSEIHDNSISSQRQAYMSEVNIDNSKCSLRQGYAHSAYSSIGQKKNFSTASGCEANFVAAEYLKNVHKYGYYNVVLSAVDQTKVYNSGYETNNNTVPKFEWQELAPIPCSGENFLMNQEFMQRYKEACDTGLSPGDDWDNQPEYKEIAKDITSATALCLPKANSLIVSSDLSSVNLKEVPDVTTTSQPAVILNEGPIDSMVTSDDGFKNNKTKRTSYKPAAKPEDNIHMEEEAQPLINIKQSKKKNRCCANKEVFSEKEHVNIVFIGHVDAGKSTLGGQLMCLTGMVDKRTIKKYEKEAKEKSRDSWYLSWALDTNQEERDRGKTVETGRGYFETKSKHFTILDAPGHKSFVPNMICGAAQADIAVLVLSARQNEFESGFDKGGQTRDHAMLARSAGLNVLIAVVNKMDDCTVQWEENRFNYCRDKTLPFLKKLGYAPSDVHFLPVSAQTGEGIMTAVPKSKCPWFKGPSLIDCLEKLSPIRRLLESPFVMPIAEKFKDMGTVVMGKVEAGSTHISNSLLVMPNKVQVTVEQIWSDNKPVTIVKAGENVKIRLKGIEEEDISLGFVLCDIKQPITIATLFDAQLHILDCKSIITKGFSAVMHFQSVAEDVTVTHLLCLVDPKTNAKTRRHNLQFVKKNDEAIMRIQCSGVVCLTVFKEFSQLGRFTLRDDNKVIAIGKVLKIIK